MLARLLDSLVRVSRRVVKDHFVKGVQVDFASLAVRVDGQHVVRLLFPLNSLAFPDFQSQRSQNSEPIKSLPKLTPP